MHKVIYGKEAENRLVLSLV